MSLVLLDALSPGRTYSHKAVPYAAGVHSIVESLVRVTLDLQHRHIKEALRKLRDQGARGPIVGVALRQ